MKRHFRFSRLGGLVGAVLRPAGWLYGWAMRIRRAAYRRGWLPSRSVSAPVICVGNLTVGGTGKTPMVAWLARRVQESGLRPAILTRGYKAHAGLSDEAALLAELTGAPVVVNADRWAGAQHAIAQGADVLLMDDGFQHLRLRRDFNLVLIDAIHPFGGGAGRPVCLPAGRLREPLSALSDADAIVLTRTDQVPGEILADLWSRFSERAPRAILATAVHCPVRVIDPAGRRLGLSSLADKRVFLFCGLGNPEGFRRTVEALRARVVGECRLGDHARYTPALLGRLKDTARSAGAELLLTTQKDAVKLPSPDLAGGAENPPVWQLAVEMEITDGREELLAAMDAHLPREH